jgi:hypothetical protein
MKSLQPDSPVFCLPGRWRAGRCGIGPAGITPPASFSGRGGVLREGGLLEGRKVFFFEKKKQKTFAI